MTDFENASDADAACAAALQVLRVAHWSDAEVALFVVGVKTALAIPGAKDAVATAPGSVVLLLEGTMATTRAQWLKRFAVDPARWDRRCSDLLRNDQLAAAVAVLAGHYAENQPSISGLVDRQRKSI